MILVVTGSRSWNNQPLLYQQLDELHAKYGISALIHGRAVGADGIAARWAQERGIMEVGIPYASAYDKQGGPKRNGWLLDAAQALALWSTDAAVLVVAFPTPESVGTWNCVTQAKARGLRIRIVREKAQE